MLIETATHSWQCLESQSSMSILLLRVYDEQIQIELNVCFLLKHNIRDSMVHLDGFTDHYSLKVFVSWRLFWLETEPEREAGAGAGEDICSQVVTIGDTTRACCLLTISQQVTIHVKIITWEMCITFQPIWATVISAEIHNKNRIIMLSVTVNRAFNSFLGKSISIFHIQGKITLFNH